MKSRNITLIGMSNVGKSFQRRALAKAIDGSEVCCDDMIEAELEPLLAAEGFSGGIVDVAKWMGQPYHPQHHRNAERYLKIEEEVVRKTVRRLQAGERLVVDTTGSVIHIDERVLNDLCEVSTVVLLDAPQRHQKKLYEQYLREPKPVIWGEAYLPEFGEDPIKALERCYPIMLRRRNALYKRIADYVVGYDDVREQGFTSEMFLEEINFC